MKDEQSRAVEICKCELELRRGLRKMVGRDVRCPGPMRKSEGEDGSSKSTRMFSPSKSTRVSTQVVKEESKTSRSEFELRDDGRGCGGMFRERLG